MIRPTRSRPPTRNLLVIGHRGMAGVARVLGSTANTITHRATSNLLLVNTAPRSGQRLRFDWIQERLVSVPIL